MPETLQIQLNGQPRSFAALNTPTSLDRLIDALGLKADRIAVEHNGEIAPRTSWASVAVEMGDKVEIVHFVGGGADRSNTDRCKPLPRSRFPRE